MVFAVIKPGTKLRFIKEEHSYDRVDFNGVYVVAKLSPYWVSREIGYAPGVLLENNSHIYPLKEFQIIVTRKPVLVGLP